MESIGLLFGGLLTSEVPYIVIMGIGFALVKTELLNVEGLCSIAKLAIEVFLPTYLFINVAGSTSINQITTNSSVIVSQLLMMAVSVIAGLIYCKMTGVDIRLKWTIIGLLSVSEIKHSSQYQMKTFCYHLTTKTSSENDYCNSITYNHCSHMFFQAFFVWYFIYQLMRQDRKNRKIVDYFLIKKTRELTDENQNQNPTEGNQAKTEEDLKGKSVVKVQEEHINTQAFIDLKKEVPDNLEPKKPIWKEILYITFGPCQICIFAGFIAGFITPFKTWMFDRTSSQVLFFDSFNNIAVTHLIVSYLMVGASLVLQSNHQFQFRFRKQDHIFVLVFRCLILPLLGILYTYISTVVTSSVQLNNAVLFNAFLQWYSPTSIDIILIVYAKQLNFPDIGTSIFLQWIFMFALHKFTYLFGFLGVVKLI